jgi:hypothetical protein
LLGVGEEKESMQVQVPKLSNADLGSPSMVRCRRCSGALMPRKYALAGELGWEGALTSLLRDQRFT